MRPAQTSCRLSCSRILRVALFAMIFAVTPVWRAQSQTPDQTREVQALEKLGLTPAVLEELSQLYEKFQRSAKYPSPRAESHMMPLLPDSTVAYIAIPNYGDVAGQGLQIFRQELKESAVLRDWWQKPGNMASTGPMMETVVEKFSEFSGYLGNEIAIAGWVEGRESRFLVAAEIRKPGLKEFLAQIVKQYWSTTTQVRILDEKEFAAAKETNPGKNFTVVVRPDYILASDLATLKTFTARLERNDPVFPSTPFGHRVAEAYHGGATVVEAADLKKILALIPIAIDKNRAFLQQTGLADLNYWISRRSIVEEKSVGEGELSFTGPRRGVAAWLAAPGQLGSLDFVSPCPVAVVSLRLKNPAEIYDDVRALATASNPDAFAIPDAFEKGLNLSLRNDVFGQLEGEVTGELVDYSRDRAEWKSILSVKDTPHLRMSLNTLLSAINQTPAHTEIEGVTYYTLQIPSAKPPMEIDYAFVNGYLISGSSREIVTEAVRFHNNGGILKHSERFRAALPPGHGSEVSALMYEDPIAVVALNARKSAPSLTHLFSQLSGQEPPVVAYVYGEEKAIRATSTSPALDASIVLMGAAIALPNLLQSKTAASEAIAVGSMRTVNTAQITYGSLYPAKGFAPNLASLGPPLNGSVKGTAERANLLSLPLADPSCTAGKWCTKDGYQFRMRGLCQQQACTDYVVIATPVSEEAGGRSFCSTSEGMIHYKTGIVPQDVKVTVKQCEAWAPLE